MKIRELMLSLAGVSIMLLGILCLSRYRTAGIGICFAGMIVMLVSNVTRHHRAGK